MLQCLAWRLGSCAGCFDILTILSRCHPLSLSADLYAEQVALFCITVPNQVL